MFESVQNQHNTKLIILALSFQNLPDTQQASRIPLPNFFLSIEGKRKMLESVQMLELEIPHFD
jgi:hypothetical protein